MEVVLTSNLVSSETGETTTACNFQTMAMNSFFIPHDLMRSQIGSYTYMQFGVLIDTIGQAFIHALLSTTTLSQRLSFLTVCLVHCLHKVSRGGTVKKKFLKFRSPDCRKMHLQHSSDCRSTVHC